jgi:tetratricopeptide (TPR) repeat protein
VRLTKYLILFLVLSFQTGLTQSDNMFIDSLLFRLESAPSNEKIDVLNDISRAYWQVSLEHSRKYAGEALKIAKDLDDKSGIADAYNRLGNAEYLMANYQEAIEHYKRSLRLRLDIDDKPGILGSYNNLYLVHDILGNRKEALMILLRKPIS